MQFSRSRVHGFFDSSKKFYVIPVYQRAYSWEEPQWKEFLNDLKEYIKGASKYYYGNVLLETIEKDVEYEIIDGQQRLTTIVIFIRSLIDVLITKKDNNYDLDELKTTYLINKGNIKIRPVDYDRAFFDALIIDGKSSYNENTPSQTRMKKAKKHFFRELSKESTKTIIELLDRLQKAEVNCIELEGKKDSALTFELENNRGRDLTNLEKLKSYFMYQMYVVSKKKEADTNIQYISNVFKNIYIIIKDLKKINEDQLLIYHCNAYLNGYSYRNIEDIKDYYKKSNNKVVWIKDFVDELYGSFSNFKWLENQQTEYFIKLNKLEIPAFVYPFILKGAKYLKHDSNKFSKILEIMEILVFRYKLINSRASIESRLSKTLLAFKGDISVLKSNLRINLNDAWYWSDSRIRSYLNDNMYARDSVIYYLLWEYEKYIQNKGYNIKICELKDEQIEHISPVTPNEGGVAAGYEVDCNNSYSEDFVNKHLNSLGNLMLISGTHNRVIGNKPFKKKLDSYNSNPLLNQQAEIKDFAAWANNNPVWDSDAINKRHLKIFSFAINRWSFDKVTI